MLAWDCPAPNVAIAQIFCAAIGSPQFSPHPASACYTPTRAPPHVPFRLRRYTSAKSDQNPYPVSALRPHALGAPTEHDQLPLPGVPSGQILAQESPQTPPPKQRAFAYSSAAEVHALKQLPLRLLIRPHVPVSAAPSPDLP